MPSADDPSTVRSLHRLVEHYTPDGVLGRGLFALGAATAAVLGLFLVTASGGGPLGVAGVLAGAAAMAAATTLALVVLWPVYLSLIGNVDSAAAYPDGAAPVADPARSAERVLKRRYASGEIDRETFERRLDGIVDYRQRRDGEWGRDDHGERSEGPGAEERLVDRDR